MTTTTTPPVVAWTNAASPEELRQWIHTRLHGMDRKWPESDDGFDPPHCLISEVVRHPEVSDLASVSLVRATCEFAREALPAWASQPDQTTADHAAAGCLRLRWSNYCS